MKAAQLELCGRNVADYCGSVSPVCSKSPCQVTAGDVQLPYKCKYINKNVKKYALFPSALLLRSIKRTQSYAMDHTPTKLLLETKKAKASTVFLALL